VPGDTLERKWELVQAAGFDGIELHGHGDFGFAARREELRRARAAGVRMPTVCVIMDHFIGDFDAARRRDAIEQMRSLLSVIAEAGGEGAITPASFGMHSNALPPFRSPRSRQDDDAVLLEGLAELGEHAAREGVVVYLEPLNRYEDHMLNRLEQAVGLCRMLGLASVRVMGDLFHMSIEEADMKAAIMAAAPHLGHIHLADSNRMYPGAGHTDFDAVISGLRDIGFAGHMAMECATPDPERTLPEVAHRLRALM
jgi:sugar phosphate isomerase/epimerase